MTIKSNVRRQFLYFLRQVPMKYVVTQYAIEGGTGLRGDLLEKEMNAALEAGVLEECGDGKFKKIDYFSY